MNGLSAFGFVLRIIRTAVQTIVNAKSVPILTNSARILNGKKPVNILTKMPVKIVVL